MQTLHIGVVIMVLAGATSACQLTKPRVEGPPGFTPANPVAGAPLTVAQPSAPQPVSATRAVALLDAVCGASLPKFGTIDATLRANGFTMAPGTTAMQSATEEVSFRLADGPGDGKTCAMTFGTTEGADAVKAAFATLGALRDTPLGPATKYRGRPAIFIYDGPGQQIGDIQYVTVRLLSER